MEYQRSERVGDLLLEVTAELLRREIHDPRLRDVALTAVKMSKDLRHARIYFNLLGGSANHDDATAGLKSASGFIRTKAAKQLNLRFVPNLEFTYDESADEAQRIDALLKQANKTEE